jgi:uncharacterized protein DUF5677
MMDRPKWSSEELRDKIWREHQQALVAFYDLMADVGQALRKLPAGWQPRSAQKVVVLHLFVRAYKTSQAVHTLFLSGFAQDAQSLLRGLTEGVIDLFYILRKPGTRARQFADYIIIGKRDWMRRMERAFPEWPIPPQVLKKVGADYTALLARRPDYKDLSRSWSSKGIADRARDANCKNLYFYYVLACQMLHTDPRSVSSYLRVGEGMDDGPSIPPPEEKKTLEIAYVCLLDAFNAANGTFKWRRGDLVRRYSGRFRREFGDKSGRVRTSGIPAAAPEGATSPPTG